MKVLKWLDQNFEEIILIVLCGIMACIMMFQVLMRYVAHNSLSWSEELTRFLFIWSSFLAISYCIRQRLSVRITVIIDALPGNGKHLALAIVDIIEGVLYAFLLPSAIGYLQQTIANGQLSTAMQIPMAVIYLAPVTGFALSVIRCIQMFFIDFKNFRTLKPAK